MANPLPQADNGLPGRTAFQSAFANSPAAGGEKAITGEAEARKSMPLDKPARVTRSGPQFLLRRILLRRLAAQPRLRSQSDGRKGARPGNPFINRLGPDAEEAPAGDETQGRDPCWERWSASAAGYFGYDRYYPKATTDTAQIAEPAFDRFRRSRIRLIPHLTIKNCGSIRSNVRISEIDQDPQAAMTPGT